MYSSNAASSGAGIRTLGVRQPSQSYAAIATSAAAAQSAKLTSVGGQSRLAARYFSSFRDRNRWTERRAYCINNSHSIVVWAKRVDRFLLSRRGGRAAERGFTLIEIFIAVAVVAILVAIALPAYKQYVARAKSPWRKRISQGSILRRKGLIRIPGTIRRRWRISIWTRNSIRGVGLMFTTTSPRTAKDMRAKTMRSTR